jgi:hypothetical protein
VNYSISVAAPYQWSIENKYYHADILIKLVPLVEGELRSDVSGYEGVIFVAPARDQVILLLTQNLNTISIFMIAC